MGNHNYRELLGRLKQGITGPIYWRQKNSLNEFTHALPVELAVRRRAALAITFFHYLMILQLNMYFLSLIFSPSLCPT